MLIKELVLSEFRNYPTLRLEPGSGLNVLVGPNGHGKTNVLEAISILTTSRSFRASRETELIRFESSGENTGLPEGASARLAAEIERTARPDISLEVVVGSTPGEKKLVRVNGVRHPKIAEMIGQLNSVFFCVQDLEIVRGDPEQRRRFLNMEISQVSPRYIHHHSLYRRVLEQRNRLLRDARGQWRRLPPEALAAWNEQLAHYGATLITKRAEFIDRLSPIANEIHAQLTNQSVQLSINYLPNVRPAQNLEETATAENFLEALCEVSADEAARGVTLVGPQRDDLQFLLGSADAKLFGSQGQQRTIALALKLAEFRLVQAYISEPPVMLLDDVFSDLDDARRKQILAFVDGECQTFLTCTNLRSFGRETLTEASVWEVSEGTLQKKQRRPAQAGGESQ